MKRILTILLVAAMMLAMVACSSGNSNTTNDAATTTNDATADGNPLDRNGDGKLTIGIEVQSMASDWHITYAKDLEEFWYANGADEVIVSSSELDVNKGITDVEAFIAANADAAFIVPDSYDAINDVVQKARDSGMLVSVNCSLEDVDSDVGQTFDHYTFGTLVGQAAGEWLLSKGFENEKVALDTYTLAKQELVDRYEGMKDKLLELCPNIQIVSETVAADAATETSNTELVLTANPDIVAYITLWDGLASLEVIKTMGYNHDDFGLFCGEQSEAQARALIDPKNVAYRSFAIMNAPDSNTLTSEEILKALKGESFSNMVTSTPPGPCTLDNVYEWYPELQD